MTNLYTLTALSKLIRLMFLIQNMHYNNQEQYPNHHASLQMGNQLADEGITAEILNTNVSSQKRFEWLEKQKELETEVLVMNMSFVQVGLDLLEWSTIIYYQLNDDINVLRQAGGHNWRIGQSKNCRIYYLVNQDTQQMAQFERLMTRRIEALLVEGRIERSSPLVQFAKENESKLARDLSYSLEATDLEKTWITAAEKDNIPKDLINYQDLFYIEKVKVKKPSRKRKRVDKIVEQFAFELF